MENKESNIFRPAGSPPEKDPTKEGRGGDKEGSEKKELKRSQEIFENMYEQLKPENNSGAIKKAKSFIEDIARYQELHIKKVDENIPVEKSVEKIWTEGMGKKLARFKGNEFERRKSNYTKMYLALERSVNQLIQSGEVEPFVAKFFLENLNSLKSGFYYNDIVRNPERPIDNVQENYVSAFEDLSSIYEKEQINDESTFHHFNAEGREKTKNRIYLSANLAESPEKLVTAWKSALIETGLQDRIYFKLQERLSSRYETIIVYQTEDVSDEEMGRVMEAFQILCPKEAFSTKNMPSSVSIAEGISYAPEPKNLNELFRAMDLTHKDSPMQISYNEMMASFIQSSFELAYKDFVSSQGKDPNPKDLKEGAEKYFEQMVKLAGINSETMVPNAQGGKLPSWIENLKNN